MRMWNMVELQSYQIWMRWWIENVGTAWRIPLLDYTSMPTIALKILHVIPLSPLGVVQSYDYIHIRTPAYIPKVSWLMLVFSLALIGSQVGEELQGQRTLAVAEDH